MRTEEARHGEVIPNIRLVLIDLYRGMGSSLVCLWKTGSLLTVIVPKCRNLVREKIQFRERDLRRCSLIK